jgi:hypothetical protein
MQLRHPFEHLLREDHKLGGPQSILFQVRSGKLQDKQYLQLEVFPFLLATSWTILTASSSIPFPIKYFGLSKIVKQTNRMKNSIREIPPIAITKYSTPYSSLSYNADHPVDN